MARLLIVHHSPTPGTAALLDATVAGARDPEISGVTLTVLPALEAEAGDVLCSDGVLLGTPANFGYMSGALKHFFDRSFLSLGGALDEPQAPAAPADLTSTPRRPLPYGLWVHGRYDTEGAVRSVQSIVGALPWRQAAPVLAVLGEVGAAQRDAAYELGATIAASLSN